MQPNDPNDSHEFEISHELQTKISDHTWLKAQFNEGKTIQNILGFDETTMDKFYTSACKIYENKKYTEAADAFFFLVTLNPYHYDYWIGLGAATQWCEDYESAVDAYEMAAICHLDNPIPYFHLAKCLFAMHDRESAIQAIDLALEYAEDRSDYAEIYQQAKTAKALLLKEVDS